MAHVDLLLVAGVTQRAAVRPCRGPESGQRFSTIGAPKETHVPHSSALLLTPFLLGRASVRGVSQRRGPEPKVKTVTSLVHPPVL